MSEAKAVSTRVGFLTAIVNLAFLWAFLDQGLAFDNGRYSQADPDLKEWIENLKDKGGINCCNTADGYDVQWDTEGDHYRVFINKHWYVVPTEAVLKVPNRLGVARVWYNIIWVSDGTWYPNIRCFLPGTGS